MACAGANTLGQLGTGATNTVRSFESNGFTGAINIDAGGDTTCALRFDHTLWCWGFLLSADNVTRIAVLSPTQVPLIDVRQIAIGARHSCAILGDKSLWCWGENNKGQLGNGSTINSASPVRIDIDKVRAVTVGAQHTCAVLTTLETYCWGANESLQLGNSRRIPRHAPTRVSNVRAVSITAGATFTCVINPAAQVQCWGRNTKAQLGTTRGAPRSRPVTVALKKVVGIDAGDAFACAVTQSGGVWCWGRSNVGQIAKWSTSPTTRPNLISFNATTPAQVIGTGAAHACTATADVGQLWCWGLNTASQLGDLTTSTARSVRPIYLNGVHVAGVGTASTATVIAAGDISCNAARNATSGIGPAGTQCGAASTGTQLSRIAHDAVLALGDLQYENGEYDNFINYYNASWGQYFDTTYPLRGNHEYGTTGASGYVSYWEEKSQAYYSTDLGPWRLLVLDSNCLGVGPSACSTTSPQARWLTQQLSSAQSSGKCVAIAMHHPPFNDTEANAMARNLYALGVAGGADLILVAHDHLYKRYGKLGPDGTVSASGARMFLSGLGGAQSGWNRSTAVGEEMMYDTNHGVLRLVLNQRSYEWQFLSAADDSVIDSGTDTCS